MARVFKNGQCFINDLTHEEMKNYRILIVAWYANLHHVSEFVRNLKKTNPKVEVSLVYNKPKVESIPDDLMENASELFDVKLYSGKIRIRLLREVVTIVSFMNSFVRIAKNKYDIVNIHYARPWLYYVIPWIKKLSKRIVISPWGSDVFRIEEERDIKHLRKVYSIADFVTNSKDSFIGQQVITKFKVNPNKMVKLSWGGEFFDFIQENSSNVSTAEAKKRFELDGRYVITCGYNPLKQQRHEEIIDAIHSVRDQLPQNLTLLLPFTYCDGWTEEYRKSIKEKGKGLGFDLVAVEERLNMPDLLKLRMATDMFIHVQASDAGARSVMEYVACNKKVVHGSWVKYAYLEDYHPSCYFPVDCMENLGECIIKAYNTPIGPLPQEVMNIILERGWNRKMRLWNSFFESLI